MSVITRGYPGYEAPLIENFSQPVLKIMDGGQHLAGFSGKGYLQLYIYIYISSKTWVFMGRWWESLRQFVPCTIKRSIRRYYHQYDTYILGKLQRPHCHLTGIVVNKRNHPQMADLFRFVNYFYVPKCICICQGNTSLRVFSAFDSQLYKVVPQFGIAKLLRLHFPFHYGLWPI